MADTLTMMSAHTYYHPARTAQDYCREMASFLKINPDAWTQGVMARGGDDYPCSPRHPFARKFCLLGLLEKFVDSGYTRAVVLGLLVRALAERSKGFTPIHHFNDATKRRLPDIISVLERASQLEGGEPIDHEAYVCKANAYLHKTMNWHLIGDQVMNDGQAIEDESTQLAMKLVPWAVIEAQIRGSVSA
jgi:hypothetical protein